MLFEITHPNGQKSVLFGTINVEGISYMPEVMEILGKAQTCVFETDMSAMRKPERDYLLSRWVDTHATGPSYPLKRKFVDSVLAHDPTQNRLAVADIPPIYMLKRLMPPISFNMTEHLMTQAKAKGKNIAYLESWDKHISALAGLQLNYEEQWECYNYLLPTLNPVEIHKEWEKSKAAYLKGDLSLGYTPPADAPEAYHRYRKTLCDDRSLQILELTKPHLAAGDAFIAVGAANLSKIISGLQENGCQVHPIPILEHQIKKQIEAFKKIYEALYAGQTSYFKKKGFMAEAGRDISVEDIETYVQANPHSRTAKAWELAQVHYREVNLNNSTLFAAIHSHSFEHSSLTFFKRSINFPNHDYQNSTLKIQEAAEHSRTGMIRAVLGS